MKYKVEKTNIIDPPANSPEWEKANVGKVDVQRWQEFYQPMIGILHLNILINIHKLQQKKKH